MKKRNTITLDQDILLIAHSLDPEEQGLFYQFIIEYFLSEKQFPATVSPAMKVAIACATPQIRRLQSKFLNGKCTKATLCPDKTSEVKRTEANGSATYGYNISSSIISNIYTLNYILSTNQPLLRAPAREPLENRTRVAQALEQLQTKDQQTFSTIIQIFENLDNNDKLKIAGELKTNTEVAIAIVNLLLAPAGVKTIIDLHNELESTQKVRNPINYFTSMLYNKSKAGTQQTTKKPDFQQRSHDEINMDSLWDEL